METTYKLGPLPWSRDTLIKAFWTNWVQVLENIKEHPGFAAHEGFEDIHFSLSLFLDNTNDLLAAIADVKNLVEPSFFARGNQQSVEQWDRKLRKHFFGVASAAFALVDANRRVSSTYPVESYQEQINKCFVNSELHNFMQGLRNFVTHKRLLTPSVQTLWGEGRKVTQLILSEKKLKDFNNWTAPAKVFIQNCRFGVDIEAAVFEYRQLVENFHTWYRENFWSTYGNQINEYLSYEKIVKGEQWKNHWKHVLNYVIERKLNPYDYLDRYLTPEEIKNALELPHGSKEQIDLMISMADEFEICDDEIRGMVYKLFSLAAEKTRQKRSTLIWHFGAVAIALIALTKLAVRRTKS